MDKEVVCYCQNFKKGLVYAHILSTALVNLMSQLEPSIQTDSELGFNLLWRLSSFEVGSSCHLVV